ncbi:MAG: hypothetical protein LC660_01435, partial [Desulfobacteraceae bacterium]|nr:hypothetical protein [Desulfobacteraceae bacterium]
MAELLGRDTIISVPEISGEILVFDRIPKSLQFQESKIMRKISSFFDLHAGEVHFYYTCLDEI